jgi:hypothetical protein
VAVRAVALPAEPVAVAVAQVAGPAGVEVLAEAASGCRRAEASASASVGRGSSRRNPTADCGAKTVRRPLRG